MSKDLKTTWKKAQFELEQLMGVENVDAWIRPTALTKCSPPTRATLEVPSRMHFERIRNFFHDAIEEVLGVKHLEIEIVEELAIDLLNHISNEEGGEVERVRPQLERTDHGFALNKASNVLRLNKSYIFNNYVVGSFNRFAQMAGRNIVQQPGNDFNPFFIHGDSGLGKTHLMQAIAHAINEVKPELKIVYLTCEEFQNHFVDAIKEGNIQTFRNRYRQVDVFIIDDIHHLVGKVKTQDEFFHTFNALYQESKQIILSCDSPPSEIEGLSERLVSRFNWGLSAQIDAPKYEDRISILLQKAHLRGFQLKRNVAEYIAKNIGDNIRDLEGCLTSLHARARLENHPIDLEMASKCIPNVAAITKLVTINHIASVVSIHFDIEIEDLKSKSRKKTLVEVRNLIIYLARKLTKMSLKEIGHFFGGRDHSTVKHSLAKLDRRVMVDDDFAEFVQSLENKVLKELD
ncbi:MAG: chromosomal replication initiator protein DnaA [Planctomycetota bacterium]|jgi:chromosomal replication initiator protein|nr:chromosomal replication initiator protein DnaA [Planctomycetota bacterium]